MSKRLGVLRRAVVVAMIVVAASLAFSAGAFAADNTGCLTCHGPGMSMPVPDVNRDTACQSCHVGGLVGTHPYHQSGSNCGSACHPGWGDSLMTAVPTYTDPVSGASFTSANSKSTSPAILHIIHSDARWPKNVDTSSSACSSCHAPAACSTCHTGAVSANHTDHSAVGNANYTAQAPWTGLVGHGVVGGNQTQRTAGVETNQCASTGCHDVEGTKGNRPAILEDYNYTAGQNPDDPTGSSSAITLVGTWRYKASSIYTGSRMSYNNVAGSRLTAAFTGKRIELVSDKDPYRGRADVYLDGAKVATIDTYSASTVYQAIVYSSDVLAPGAHTISVRPLNTRNASARATFVVIDSFRVYANVPDSIAPACLSCHGDKSTGHGDMFSHEATHTVGVESGFACTSCHSMSMFAEHARTSSKTTASSCGACHTTYAPFVLNDYDFTCGGTAATLDGAAQPCHNNAGQQKHDFVDSNHDASAGANGTDCKGCHGTELSIIHTEGSARAYNAKLSANTYSVSCLSCHGTAVFPTTKDCTSSLCHNASFSGAAVTMDNHVPVAHPATNNGQAAVLRTGGYSCSSCHTMELTGEHAKTSSLTSPGNATVRCSNCHSASYLPANWLDTLGTTNTCIVCHAVGSGMPSATGAGEPHEAAEYNTKHDFRPYGTNAASCGPGAGLYCHNAVATPLLGEISFADLLHDSSKPGNASCLSCHGPSAPPSAYSCTTVGCHSAAKVPHNKDQKHLATAGAYPQNAECLACHTDFTDLAAHGGCWKCHGNAVLTANNTRYLNGNFTARCIDCHNATVIGTHVYTPKDPNHYTGSETTHTASAQTGTVSGFACTQCHKTEMKPEHFKASSAFSTSDKCVECHTVKVAALVGAWDKTCDACHTPKHTDTTTKHDVSANACTGAGCHNVDVSVIHAESIATNSMHPNCATCHANNTTVPTELSCAAVGCHAGMTAHGHTLAASTYNNATVTGCTDAGAGCHGVAPADYQVVHPNSGCTSGACHTAANHNLAQYNDPNTCMNCHGGGAVLYDGAPDVVGLMDTGTSGHYNETTHTATGMGNVVRGTTNGTASATCANCHNGVSAAPDGFYTQHQGVRTGSLTCFDCHNKNAAIQTIVTDATRTDTCVACHTASVLGATEVQHATSNAPAVLATSSLSCGATGTNCHVSYDLHELHKSASAGCNLTGCHDYTKQGIKPTGKTCGQVGGCHTTYTVSSHAHATDAAKHQPTNTTQADAVTFYATACGACHDIRNSNSSLTLEHNLATSAKTTNATNVCLNCHNNADSTTAISSDWSARDTTLACSTCHTGALVIHADKNSTAHSDVLSAGCSNSGVGCHNTDDLSNVGVTNVVNTTIHA
ncbi:MAG: hypothetical protein Q7V14_03135, partial [Coriobacteriia bacterium]|nr:hypothetical protein [Coriobacteriia bacterium]